jgi:precorrin-6B methylase 2
MLYSPSEKVPPYMQVLSMLFGAYVSQAVLMIAEFRLADLVRDGKKSTAQLAEATHTDESHLYRLLRTLVSLGIFAEPEPGYFAATELSACLQSDSAETLYNMALLLVGFAEKSLSGLSYSLRTGKLAFEHLYGKDVWHYFAEDDPETGALFNRAMTSLTASLNQSLVDAYDFSAIGTLVDVGGGEGSFLVTALERNPALKGILFDRPSVIEQARERFAQAKVADRCELIAGDFLQAVPQGADAYVLKHVLVDWDDAACATILRNCIKAMKRDGRILIVDTVPGPGRADLLGRLNDLNMMINTGGRVREEDEFRKLFASVGLFMRRILPTRSSDKIIEAVIA